MKILIKLGGTLLDSPEQLQAIANQLSSVSSEYEVAVVHGGGKEVTRFLAGRGVESQWVNGLRVSDQTVIDAVVKVIAGSVNKRLVSAVLAAGKRAVGISGVDGLLTRAVQLDPALQFVGRPVQTDGSLLDLLIRGGYMPVVACIAADSSGKIYNVNADVMAVSAALDWSATKLFFLTDVPGVKDGTGSLLPSMTSADIKQLIAKGAATGGMQAKLEAADTALAEGMEVAIAFGGEADIIPRLLRGEKLGTRLMPNLKETRSHARGAEQK